MLKEHVQLCAFDEVRDPRLRMVLKGLLHRDPMNRMALKRVKDILTQKVEQLVDTSDTIISTGDDTDKWGSFDPTALRMSLIQSLTQV
jgi:hypothetical protein